MAGMIKNIFGLNTEDLRRQEMAETKQLAQRLSKTTGDNYGVTAFGTAFGKAASKGLLSKMGYEDPALTQAKENEALQEQFDNIDKSTAQGNYEAAQLLDKAGRPELAVQYRNVALRMAEQSKKNRKEVYSNIPLDPNDILGSKIKQREDLLNRGVYESVKELDKEIVELSQLPSSLTKRVSSFTDSSFKNREEAFRMEDLAKGFKEQDAVGGIRGKAIDAFKEFAGAEDAVSVLKVQFNKIRADRTLSNLPPGAASDKDVQIVLGAFLSENANGKTAAKFLRGIAKMNKIKAEQGRFRVNYIKETKGNAGYLEAWEAYKKSDAFAKKLKELGIGAKEEEEATTSKPVKNFKIINGKIIQNK